MRRTSSDSPTRGTRCLNSLVAQYGRFVPIDVLLTNVGVTGTMATASLESTCSVQLETYLNSSKNNSPLHSPRVPSPGAAPCVPVHGPNLLFILHLATRLFFDCILFFRRLVFSSRSPYLYLLSHPATTVSRCVNACNALAERNSPLSLCRRRNSYLLPCPTSSCLPRSTDTAI